MNAGKRLLVVDDDYTLAEMIKERFETQGYEVITFTDADSSLRHVQTWGLPHLALIDINLPTIQDGFDLSEKLKKLGDVPIIFISGNQDTDTVVRGLTLYGDDYLVKPVRIRELVARVDRVLTRLPGFEYAQSPEVKVDDNLAVDFGRSRLITRDRNITLTPIEASLLHILMRHAGQVVTSETLIARVWPSEEVYEDRLRVHMHRLRRKLEPDMRHPRYIQTERGTGYRFIQTEFNRPK